MGFINDELQEVSKLCQNVVDGSRLVCCVQSMVRVEITKTQFKKIIVCIQFPQDYPKVPLLIELKSKTLSEKLLNGLTSVCEKECENLLGKAQILPILKFISNFIEENALVCCYDEIASLKKLLLKNDELKLKQKTSMIYLKAQQGSYYLKTKIVIPDNYPERSVGLEDTDSNFPAAIVRYILGKGKELGRQCVEPPIKEKARATLFQPSPSLNTVASFLVRSVKMLPMERCQLCRKLCLPEKPEEAVIDENADLHVERLYCGHLFHLQCLITYMKTPPFHGGKKCPSCGQRVYHDKWRLSERLAEERWAHQQARARELAEVADFFE